MLALTIMPPAYMLVHQLRRINSPAVLVTSCDAQFFPLLQGEGMFDRVLADVPCSVSLYEKTMGSFVCFLSILTNHTYSLSLLYREMELAERIPAFGATGHVLDH